jgi:hypothetical protein
MKSVSQVTGTSEEDLAASFLRSPRAENESVRAAVHYEIDARMRPPTSETRDWIANPYGWPQTFVEVL